MTGINSYFSTNGAGRYLAQLFASIAEAQGSGAGLTLVPAGPGAGTMPEMLESMSRIAFEAAALASRLNEASRTATDSGVSADPTAFTGAVMKLSADWAELTGTGGAFAQDVRRTTYASGDVLETWAYSPTGGVGSTTGIGGAVVWASSGDPALPSGVSLSTTDADDSFQIVSTDSRIVSASTGGGNDRVAIVAARTVVVDAGSGDDLLDIVGSAQDVRGGDGADTVLIAEGYALGVGGGRGNDTITLSGRSFKQDVFGGAGNDVLDISSDFSVYGVFGDHFGGEFGPDDAAANQTLYGRGAFETETAAAGDLDGNDIINITLNDRPGFPGSAFLGTVAHVEAGSGDDRVTVRSQADVRRIGGGAGDDVLDIQGVSVSDVSGGTGADTIRVDARTAAAIRGGAGDDAITFVDTQSASLAFARGDGSDLVTIAGRTEIFFESLSTDNATVSRGENTITIEFPSGERITINHAYGLFEGDEPALELRGSSLVIS